jgi:ABC-2 type transport system permease protein
MDAAIIEHIRQFLGFSWLTGPVFDKELRVSSRKRRNYVLRFAYISLLLTLLLFIWINVVDYRNTNVIQVSRMAQAGKDIVSFIVWFQFCAAQLIAIIMLSNSISDEIYHKTLGMLMTTPITSLQIVMGKLFSKIFQLLLLLAISLPLLAIVRMFGGVPWKYVISSLSITFTTVLFISSLSLFFSIFCRKSYVVIILTVLTLFALFALIPFLYVAFINLTGIYKTVHETTLLIILFEPNPYLAFYFQTMAALNPGSLPGSFFLSVYVHCSIMLAASSVLLLLSIILVRRVALRQATGQLLASRRRRTAKNGKIISESKRHSATISVIGPPVLWKELILPVRKRTRIYRIIGAIIFLLLLFYSYWFFMVENAIADKAVQVFYALIFMGLAALFTIVLSATSITSEKESRSWPLLLTSTLNDSQIVIGKFYGALSRSMPAWILLILHVFYFSITGIMHPAGFLLTVILATWFIFFLCSTGLYFSSLFKHTTTAVIMNFVFAAVIWGIVPLILGIYGEIVDDHDAAEVLISINPFIQIIVIMISTIGFDMSHQFERLVFDWPMGNRNFHTTLTIFIISFCIYMTPALIFLWRAKKRLRRKVF